MCIMQTSRQQSTLPCVLKLTTMLFTIVLLNQAVLIADSQAGIPNGDGQQAKNMIQLVQPDGKSDYEIMVAVNASVAAKEGGSELQRLIETVTGARLPLVSMPTVGRKQIIVGAHPLANAGVDTTCLEPESFEIKARNGQLQLLGRDDDRPDFLYVGTGQKGASIGTYFAVIEFARKFLGVEWYMPGPLGEEAPLLKGLAVPADLYMVEKPFFPIRFVTVPSKNKYKEMALWGRRMLNGSTKFIDIQHAWFMWLPPEEPVFKGMAPRTYGTEHPEYFALRGGKRANYYREKSWHAGGQLCVSNPDVARIYAENIIAYAKRTGERSFSMSVNDGGGHCQCEQCRAWDVTPAGNKENEANLSDRMFRFSNLVAERVLKEVPDAVFGVIAYHDTRTVPEANVNDAIVVADVYNGLPYLFHSPSSFAMMEKDMRQWRQKAKRVLLDSYYFNDNFNWGLPWSTLDVQSWMIRLMAEYPSSTGLYLDYGLISDGAPSGLLGPDTWVVSQLLWNPHQSVEILTAKFYLGAFGPDAGPLIRQYFELINNAMKKAIRATPQTQQNVDMGKVVSNVIPAYESVRVQCRKLIDQAVKAVAGQPERYRWRVDQIARSWKFAEVTMDAVAAAKAARSAAHAERNAAWDKAVQLGKQRQEMLADKDNCYAVAPLTVKNTDVCLSLGCVSEIPNMMNTSLEVPKLSGKVKIDGRLDEPLWENAALSPKFKANYTSAMPGAATRIRIFYTDDGLYIGFDCTEKDMGKMKVTANPAQIWDGEVIEAFLLPTSKMDTYMQFSVNPDGLGKEIIKRGDQGIDLNWKTNWQYAAARNADNWCVEIFIPWGSLGLTGAPAPGTEWNADFFRERYTNGTELSAWAPTGAGFAQPGKFGQLKFTASFGLTKGGSQ